MLDKLKSMTALAGLMKDKQRVQETAERVKRELAALRVEGQAGGGAVRITASGDLSILDVNMSPALAAGLAASGPSRDYAQTLIRDATNDALARARAKMRQTLQREADAMGLGDVLGDLGGLESLVR